MTTDEAIIREYEAQVEADPDADIDLLFARVAEAKGVGIDRVDSVVVGYLFGQGAG